MTDTQKNILYVAFVQVLVATLGGLFFGEVKGMDPCVLCWYQRIAMYPLIVILAVSIIRGNRDVALYVLPLSLTGLALAVYHNLLYWGIISESGAVCTAGGSCTTKFFEWFGFIYDTFFIVGSVRRRQRLHAYFHKG